METDTASRPLVTSRDIDGVRVIVADNPPVNALGYRLRVALRDAFAAAEADPDVVAVVIRCAGKGFFAGADIRELGQARSEPRTYNLADQIAAMSKPTVAAIHRHALGGGLELALACTSRIATPDARLGLPEVKLGILPGGGGTQRLPRLIGIPTALDMISTGSTVSAKEALAFGLIDGVAEGDPEQAALEAAARLLASGSSRRIDGAPLAPPSPSYFDDQRVVIARRQPGLKASLAIVEAVELTTKLPLAEGLLAERKLFSDLVDDPSSRALRHLFFAERAAAHAPGVSRDTPRRPVTQAAVIGAGLMGSGIAMCFADAGIPVRLVDIAADSVERGLANIRKLYAAAVEKGRIDAAVAEQPLGLISAHVGGVEHAAGCDLVVEAVIEDIGLKKQVFAALDTVLDSTAILATNTSSLDVDAIAAVTKNPCRVLGLHFFSPAHVMRLVEIVRAAQTAPDVVATSIDLVKKLGKIPVIVGVCDGFVGNRMLAERTREAERLLHDGVMPEDIDAALVSFGFPMGHFAAVDLSGIDVNWRVRQSRGTPLEIADTLYSRGRYGQKTMKGYYRYEPGSRKPLPDPEVQALIRDIAARDGGPSGTPLDPQAILDRLLFPIINAGARVLAEGIAQRPGDIDIVWVNGYGWPAATGGPMDHADTIGLPVIVAALRAFYQRFGEPLLKPSDLLVRLAEEGKPFSSLN